MAGTGDPSDLDPAIALRKYRGALAGIALFSAACNVLVLTGSIFMLEIYDRVLPSRSVATLIGLAVLASLLYAAHAGFEIIRTRLLGRVAVQLDADLSSSLYEKIVRIPVTIGVRADTTQPLRDLDNLRAFLSSLGPTALFDLPWIPFYLAIIFAFHPLLGISALGGALVLATLTILTEVLTRRPAGDAAEYAVARHRLAEAGRHNAEVIAAMGLAHRLGERWSEINRSYLRAHRQANDVSGGLGAISRVLRIMLQSAVLGVGAYLVIQQEATAGIIIAGSILTARALAPIDLAIAHWKGFVVARQSWRRLQALWSQVPRIDIGMALPAPCASLAVEGVSVVPPGERRLVVQDVSFVLARGQGLGIIGPSASGKSSLARAIVGAWRPVRGKVRLDGAALDQWASDLIGRHIGYLPQDVELFAGTVGENIARFETGADMAAITAAARAADVHELILRLPRGYDTPIGEQGTALSAGQRQRIGLARTLYKDPFLVVLDEPDANLDAEGVLALTRATVGVKSRGGIIVVIAHRQNVLAGVDLVLAMSGGRPAALGPKEAVMRRLRVAGPGPEGLKVVGDASGG